MTMRNVVEGRNMNGMIYGMSAYMQPDEGPRLIAEAELENFAPCPCVCCLCLVNDKQRKRTYIKLYENRLESNWPCAPCCCCTKERCISDFPMIYYFDKLPSRAGMCCYCIPCICCGPPVLFNHIPRCLFSIVDCRPCFGEAIRSAPCNCFNLRCCICIGTPCYYYCSVPMFWPVKHGERFLGKYKGALEQYRAKHGLRESEMAIFKRIADRFCDCDSVRNIEAEYTTAPATEVIDRGNSPGLKTVTQTIREDGAMETSTSVVNPDGSTTVVTTGL